MMCVVAAKLMTECQWVMQNLVMGTFLPKKLNTIKVKETYLFAL